MLYHTHVLLIQDTGSNIDEVRFMLEQLDIPVRQVMIEARIVIARSDAAEELGVQWGIAYYEVGDDPNTGVLIQGNRGGLTEALRNLT